MTDATTGQGAEGARRGEKATGGQSNAPQSDQSKGPQGEESAPIVAGHGARDTSGAETGGGSRSRGRLLPHDECDKFSLRLQHAVAGFVDGPRTAVEEADQVMEEVASRVTDALTQRRRTLRMSWQEDGGEDKQRAVRDTEQLRLALRDYRELADRLLHL